MKQTIRIILSFTLLIILLLGCNDERKEKLNQEFGTLPTQLIDTLNSISSNNQLFRVSTLKSNTIVGKKGTILIIPSNSLITENGKKVNGEVTIQLKENYSIKDYLLSNLQTVHNNQLLESQGMIYLSAKDSSGEILKIANNKSVRILIPQKNLNKNSKIFLGDRMENGLINWDSINDFSKSLTPYPIKFISNKYNGFTECLLDYGITKDTLKRDFNYYGNITDFENSILATKEFSERYYFTCWDPIVEIYINNLDKNLWEIDEMVVEFFVKDSIERVGYYINNPPPKVNGKPVTKDQWNAHNWLLSRQKESSGWYIKTFKEFAKLKLTKVDSTKFLESSKLDSLNTTLLTYDAMKFGWVNIDYFYEDPKSTPLKLAVKTNKKAEIINLIIKGRSVILSGLEKKPNEYWFTKNEDGYNKLPKGEKGIIMAIGFDQNGVTFGEKEIIIGDYEVESIELENVSAELLKNRLEKYGS